MGKRARSLVDSFFLPPVPSKLVVQLMLGLKPFVQAVSAIYGAVPLVNSVSANLNLAQAGRMRGRRTIRLIMRNDAVRTSSMTAFDHRNHRKNLLSGRFSSSWSSLSSSTLLDDVVTAAVAKSDSAAVAPSRMEPKDLRLPAENCQRSPWTASRARNATQAELANPPRRRRHLNK